MLCFCSELEFLGFILSAVQQYKRSDYRGLSHVKSKHIIYTYRHGEKFCIEIIRVTLSLLLFFLFFCFSVVVVFFCFVFVFFVVVVVVVCCFFFGAKYKSDKDIIERFDYACSRIFPLNYIVPILRPSSSRTFIC